MVSEIPQTTLKTNTRGFRDSSDYFKKKTLNTQDSFKLLQKQNKNGLRDPSNYFKNQAQRVREMKFFWTTSKTRYKWSPRFFQITTKTKQNSETTSKNRHKGHPRFFQTTSKTKQKESQQFFQTTSKTKEKGSPRIFQLTSKPKQGISKVLSNDILQKQNKRCSGDSSKLL